MPLWFPPLIGSLLFNRPVSVYDDIKTGELLLLSSAIVGPLVYIITKGYGEKERDKSGNDGFLYYTINFPYGIGFVFACIMICLISSFAFYVLRNPLIEQNELVKLVNYGGVIKVSWATFISSTVIFFCAMAYRNSLQNITGVMPSEEEDFVRQWENQK